MDLMIFFTGGPGSQSHPSVPGQVIARNPLENPEAQKK